jgi:hypothetical protein
MAANLLVAIFFTLTHSITLQTKLDCGSKQKSKNRFEYY